MSEEETIARLKKLDEPAIICQHLLMNPDSNFNFPGNMEEDNEAWCDECEKILRKEGSWTDRVVEFAGLKPCCRYCFAEFKQKCREKL